MPVPSKLSGAEIILSLMCSSGIMLVVSGVPAAILVGIGISHQMRLDVNETATLTAAFTLLVAALGFILYWSGIGLWRRKRRMAAAKAVAGP